MHMDTQIFRISIKVADSAEIINLKSLNRCNYLTVFSFFRLLSVGLRLCSVAMAPQRLTSSICFCVPIKGSIT